MEKTFALRPFVPSLCERLGMGDADVHARYAAATRDALRARFGDATPLELTFEEPHGIVRLCQVLTVVEGGPADATQITAKNAALFDATVAVGSELRVPIAYGFKAFRAIPRALLDAKDLTPLPLFAPGLESLLGDALQAQLARDLPEPQADVGSLRELLRQAGAWTVGLSATHENVTVTVERGVWRSFRTSLTDGEAELGFDLRILGLQDDLVVATMQLPLSSARDLGSLPAALATPERRRAFVDVLGALARRLVEEGRPRSSETELAAELIRIVAPLPPPADGSLHAWIERVVVPRLRAIGTKASSQELTMLDRDGGRRLKVRLGLLHAWSLRYGPGVDEEAALVDIVDRFVAALPARAERLFAAVERGSVSVEGGLTAALEARLRFGPPGTPAVPAWSEEAITAARARISFADEDDPRLDASAEPLAVLSVDGYLIELSDRFDDRYWSLPSIRLWSPGLARWSSVLVVDAHDPMPGFVVDGDAFAFRRVLEWLRRVIELSELDLPLSDDDIELDDADPHNLSEWLRLGAIDFDDATSLDWRIEDAIVFSGDSRFVAELRNRSPDQAAKMREDAAAWRRFLCEVLDPRFATITPPLARGPLIHWLP